MPQTLSQIVTAYVAVEQAAISEILTLQFTTYMHMSMIMAIDYLYYVFNVYLP